MKTTFKFATAIVAIALPAIFPAFAASTLPLPPGSTPVPGRPAFPNTPVTPVRPAPRPNPGFQTGGYNPNLSPGFPSSPGNPGYPGNDPYAPGYAGFYPAQPEAPSPPPTPPPACVPDPGDQH